MGVVEAEAEVFVVDDDQDVREALVELFSREGYQVRAFASAEQAWGAIHRGGRPAAIVLDLWLPGMSGRQFIAQLRASAHAAIPVVVLSGSGWTEQIECGGDDFLRKPIEGRAAVRAVDRLIARGGGSGIPTTATANPAAASRARPPGSHRPR